MRKIFYNCGDVGYFNDGHIENDNCNLNNKLKKILTENDVLSMEEIQKLITPVISECDVFISYSHKDENIAKYIAYELMKERKTVFFDYLYWGNIDDALKVYDNKNCKKDNGYYSYEERNKSTSLFHMILVDSIWKTIENCKTFILIKTQNSSILEKTYSPWIYLEVEIVNRLKTENSLILDHYEQKNKITFPLKIDDFIEVNSLQELINHI